MSRRRRRRKSDPHFVSAQVLPDGSVEAIDQDGERFHLTLHRNLAYPIVGRMVRDFEMRETAEKLMKEQRPLPRPPSPHWPFVTPMKLLP